MTLQNSIKMLFIKVMFNVYLTSLEIEVLGRDTGPVKIISVLGPGSSVGIATGYDWTVRKSNRGGGEAFRTCPDRPWGPHSFLNSGYRVFPGGKERPGRDADPSHLLVP
jgi:hypothetical protein